MTSTESVPSAPTSQEALNALLRDILPSQGAWSEAAYRWLTDHSNRLIEFTDGHIQELRSARTIPIGTWWRNAWTTRRRASPSTGSPTRALRRSRCSRCMTTRSRRCSPAWPPTWLHVLTPRRSELELGLIHRRRLSLSPAGQPGTGPHRSGVSTCLSSTAPRHC